MADTAESATTEDIHGDTSQNIHLRMAEIENDRSDLVEAVAKFVKETQASVLDLEDRRLNVKEVQSILSFLPDSQVTELNLKGNCLADGMVDLSQLLVKTKIRKLNVIACGLTKEDILRLAELLQDSEILNLQASRNNYRLSADEGLEFLACLKKSKLTTLFADFFGLFSEMQDICLLREFLNTAITCFHPPSSLSSKAVTFLLANLGRSSITELNLDCGKFSSLETLKEFSSRLAETQIEKLDLGGNNIDVDGLDILVKGLISSKVTDLNLMNNRIASLLPLFTKLKETQIRTLNVCFNHKLNRDTTFILPDSLRHSSLTSLDLNHCGLSDEAGEALMESLRFSNVLTLDIRANNVGLLTVRKLSKNVSDINLTDLDISFNSLSFIALFILGACLEKSKLSHVDVSSSKALSGGDFFSFLKLTQGSSITRIDMNKYSVTLHDPPVCESVIPMNLTFTELHLHDCNLGDSIPVLVRLLKRSVISHLNLSDNRLNDKDVIILAKNLRETQIRRLNLSCNEISSAGAKALARAFRDSNLLYLDLTKNLIEDEGLEFLAEHAKDTFISELEISGNEGKRTLVVDKVLWHNKIAAHKLVSVFKQIVWQTKDKFCFDQSPDSSDISAFLEKCLWFYKTVIDKPQAITILLEEKVVSLSREEVTRLVVEEFPRQFSQFIACRIEADVTQHVSLLEKAETMGLVAIVESLLLNRPVFVIDEEHSILHPYVYKLLLKYKHPICNLAVEPRGVEKIMEYFTKHIYVESAEDVISLLRDAKLT